MDARELSEGLDKRTGPRTKESGQVRNSLVEWYLREVYSCEKCAARRKRYVAAGVTGTLVPPPMPFIGKAYGDPSGPLPILFVGGNPWLADAWIEGIAPSDLARWWELKVYEWLDYRLGSVLEAISPLARALWNEAKATGWQEGSALDHVAFTNLYLCPLGDAASKPTSAAAERCVDHLLSELSIVRPKVVVIFGDFAWHTLHGISKRNGSLEFAPVGDDDACAELNTKVGRFPVLTLSHPSRPQFSPEEYIDEAWFRRAVRWCLGRV